LFCAIKKYNPNTKKRLTDNVSLFFVPIFKLLNYIYMPILSQLASTLVGSEIVKLGNEINNRIKNGEKIYNYTIGDFSPAIFPIPEVLKQEIITAYNNGSTNYPPADGILPLRRAVSEFMKTQFQIDYADDEIQIASGGRPLIYTLFQTIVDKEDKVIYAIPSWNNNHYTNLVGGSACEIITTPEHNFMPTAADLKPHLKGAALLCLCTPQNPTGTTLDAQALADICDLVIAENNARGSEEKKLYVLFDQMYSTLTFGDTKHVHPTALRPEMKDYTITIDGISKSFAATGVRVGWSLGPKEVMAKMKALLSHIGAWAPMAEQVATAAFLNNNTAVQEYNKWIKGAIEERLWAIYNGITELKEKGFAVDAIKPQAAIYLTIKFDFVGKTFDGKLLATQADVTQFLLSAVGLAVVPFHCFGADPNNPWYRISVGTCTLKDIETVFQNLNKALSQLK
jgi:aspartate aminotransferase